MLTNAHFKIIRQQRGASLIEYILITSIILVVAGVFFFKRNSVMQDSVNRYHNEQTNAQREGIQPKLGTFTNP